MTQPWTTHICVSTNTLEIIFLHRVKSSSWVRSWEHLDHRVWLQSVSHQRLFVNINFNNLQTSSYRVLQPRATYSAACVRVWVCMRARVCVSVCCYVWQKWQNWNEWLCLCISVSDYWGMSILLLQDSWTYLTSTRTLLLCPLIQHYMFSSFPLPHIIVLTSHTTGDLSVFISFFFRSSAVKRWLVFDWHPPIHSS